MAEFRQNDCGNWQQAFAGDVFNTAVYLKRLSAQTDVAFASVVGIDMFSRALRTYCDSEMLNSRWLKCHQERSCGLYFIQTDSQGERQFSYYRENSAARTLIQMLSDDDWLEFAEQMDWVFVSAISLAILSEENRQGLFQQLQRLQRCGVKLAFDTNYRSSLWECPDIARVWIYKMLAGSDLAFAGAEDMAGVLNHCGMNAKDVARELTPLKIPELVIKAGKEQVLVITPNYHYAFEIEPVDTVVDTTAAGDSFNAGYLAALLDGQPLSERVQWAASLASEVIQHAGAIIPPSAMPTMVLNTSDS